MTVRFARDSRAVGVDDAGRHGWVGVALDAGRFHAAAVRPTVAELLEALPGASHVGIDIPIFLVDHVVRDADREARAFLGRQASSVFPTAPRRVVEASTYEEACSISEALCGKKISRQAFALHPRILEVDGMLPDERLFEAHPEVSFRLLREGTPFSGPKKSWSGLLERIEALRSVGIALPSDLGEAGRAAPDDVVDAAVAAWSADRIARGVARTFPAEPTHFVGGRPVAIWA